MSSRDRFSNANKHFVIEFHKSVPSSLYKNIVIIFGWKFHSFGCALFEQQNPSVRWLWLSKDNLYLSKPNGPNGVFIVTWGRRILGVALAVKIS